jgi:hypothetical protein
MVNASLKAAGRLFFIMALPFFCKYPNQGSPAQAGPLARPEAPFSCYTTKPNVMMKKLVFLLLLACCWQMPAFGQNSEVAKIVFDEPEHNFGEIKQGDKVEWTFTFRNDGKAPLVLTNVSTTCGCTAPEWPRDPVMPGGEATIVVRFNSAGKSGMQNKVITIYSNASNNPEYVKIKANVLQ